MDDGASSYRRFLNGEDSGFVEIIRDNMEPLIFYLNGFVNNLSTAEELAEDTFVKIAIKKPRFNGKLSFKTWLFAIGRNVAVDYCRRQAIRREISLDDCQNDSTDDDQLICAYLKEERKAAIHRAMRCLKTEYRQVLWLTYFEEFTNRETAKIMRKTTHNIETLLYRARRSLKAKLDEEGFYYEEL